MFNLTIWAGCSLAVWSLLSTSSWLRAVGLVLGLALVAAGLWMQTANWRESFPRRRERDSVREGFSGRESDF